MIADRTQLTLNFHNNAVLGVMPKWLIVQTRRKLGGCSIVTDKRRGRPRSAVVARAERASKGRVSLSRSWAERTRPDHSSGAQVIETQGGPSDETTFGSSRGSDAGFGVRAQTGGPGHANLPGWIRHRGYSTLSAATSTASHGLPGRVDGSGGAELSSAAAASSTAAIRASFGGARLSS